MIGVSTLSLRISRGTRISTHGPKKKTKPVNLFTRVCIHVACTCTPVRPLVSFCNLYGLITQTGVRGVSGRETATPRRAGLERLACTCAERHTLSIPLVRSVRVNEPCSQPGTGSITASYLTHSLTPLHRSRASASLPPPKDRRLSLGSFNPSSLNVDLRPLHGALCPTESLFSQSTLFLLLLFAKKMLKGARPVELFHWFPVSTMARP